MKSNNPFKTHGIEHLSPSKINLWITDPALFIGTYLCGMKGSYGVGAFRGTAVEHALEKKLSNKDFPQKAIDEFLYGSFDKECVDIIKIKPNIRLLLINNFNVKKKEIEIKSLKKFISPLPLLLMQIVKKSSSEPELNVISFEIIYSGIHLSECIIHFNSETFFET